GAGWDLYGNLVFWCLGINRQTVMDLSRWVRPDFVNGAIRHLQRDPPEGAVRTPGPLLPENAGFDQELERIYGIRYLAPADARAARAPATALPSRSSAPAAPPTPRGPPPLFDHPPTRPETRSLSPPPPAATHVSAYSDPFAHGHTKIPVYNFLPFGSQE